jgi:hypothetical protein
MGFALPGKAGYACACFKFVSKNVVLSYVIKGAHALYLTRNTNKGKAKVTKIARVANAYGNLALRLNH